MHRLISYQKPTHSAQLLEKAIGKMMKHSDLRNRMQQSFICKKIAGRAVAIVLSECLDKLSILRIITQEKIEPHWLEPIAYKTLEEKFGNKEDNYEIFLYTDKKKLARDLTFITKLLSDTIDDVLHNGDITKLINSLDICLKEKNEAEGLLQEYEQNKVLLRKLTYDMRKSSSRNKEAFNKKSDEAYQMHEQYEQTLAYGIIEYKYVDNWETNRTYLGHFQNAHAEGYFENIVSSNKTKEELENRINHEISNFMEVIMTDLQQQIEYWMTKYDDDVDRLEKSTFELKVAKEKLEIEFASATNLYAERQKEIEEWITFRDKLRAEEELEKKILWATVKIQSWWRGVMVRKHLGPYSKKKGKKGKDKKGKKGKK